MDAKTSVETLKNRVARMRSVRHWNTGARSAAISIVLEASELLEHFQWEDGARKIMDRKIDRDKKAEIEAEVADVLVYLCDFANELEIDLSGAVAKKLKKIDEKYPVERILHEGGKFYLQQKKKYREGRKVS